MAEVIPVAAPIIGDRELAYVTDAIRSGWVSSAGPYIDRFEAAFAEYVGCDQAVAVSNGTVALHLALHALGIGPGDEVVVPDLTFVATANAVLQAGATPVLADVDPTTWCLDPAVAERAVGPKTKAIIAVHLYGQPADTDALGAMAERCGAILIEDAAEAHGAARDGRRVGSLGLLGTFSFYGNKIITSGEGGMITTNDQELAERVRFLKDQGMRPERRYFHTELAFNYRMTNLQAALGLAQLEQIETFIEKKRQIHAWYAEELASFDGVATNTEAPGTRNVFWMTCAVLAEALDRDRIAAEMRIRGVDTRPFFVPMSRLPHLSRYRAIGAETDSCTVAASLSAQGLNLPSGCALSRSDVSLAARSLRELL